MSGDAPAGGPEPRPRSAVERRSRWPGWIWAVPLAAVGIVAWLAVRSWSTSGPDVVVIFPEIANLKPGNTKVKYQTAEVGEVEDVRMDKDLRHMRVTLSLHADMQGHLGPGTRFWIAGKQLSLTNLDIGSLISGPFVAVDPKPGAPGGEFNGLPQPPAVRFSDKGSLFALHADRLGGVGRGTPIYNLGEQVGTVQDYRMVGGRGFEIDAFIDAPNDALVHSGTRFWNAGAVHVSTAGGGPSVQLQSLPALFDGAIAFETPAGPTEGPESKPHDQFTLYDSKDTAENAPGSDAVSYRMVFNNASGLLERNAAVKLMGARVGSVTGANLVWNPATRQLSIDARVALEPSRIALAGGAVWNAPRAQMDALMRHLIGEGLRAQLSSSPPVIGGQIVTLRITPGQRGTLLTGDPPEIPTASESGVADIMAKASDVANKIDQLPLPQIAENVQTATGNLSKLTASPDLSDTLRNVDRSSADLEDVTSAARRQLPATLAGVRQAVAAAQASLASARDLMSVGGSSAPQSGDLPGTLYEVTRAARSLRELSDLLDRHPEALLTGRGRQQ